MRSRNNELPIEVELEQAEESLAMFEAMTLLMRDPHSVLDVLLAARDPDDGNAAIRERFGFTEVQALAVMDLQFRRVTQADRDNIESRRQELQEHVALLREGH